MNADRELETLCDTEPPAREAPSGRRPHAEQCFCALVDRHRPRLLALVERVLGDPCASEDVCQEAFLRLWRHLQAGKLAGDPSGWLTTVAMNLARDHLRRRRVRRELDAAEFLSRTRSAGVVSEEMRERCALLLDAATGLPTRQGDAFRCCILEGRTYKETADRLGGTAATARRNVREAVTKLRRAVERAGVGS